MKKLKSIELDDTANLIIAIILMIIGLCIGETIG